MNDARQRFETRALPHLDAAYNLARWLARPPLDADDIVQDSMLRAFRAFDSFRGEDVKPWLLSIVRNCFLTAAARSGHRLETALPADDDAVAAMGDPAMVAPEQDAETLVIHGEQGRRFSEIVESLPRDFREVLMLREMEDLSYREIAQITGAPIGTVMSRLARARALLKQAWLDEPLGASDAVR